MEHDRLLWSAAAATAAFGSSIATGSTAPSRRSTTARRSFRSRAFACTAATARGEYATGQRERVIVGHFEIPGDSPRLRDPCNSLARDHAGLDIQHRLISDLVHGSAI